ncbi:MAG: hypothetical protein Q9166_005310 [cf. Caloplaca sp. 2 TL-2023]
MIDDIDEAEDERATELSTISAIYPELLVDASDQFAATIDVTVEPVRSLFVFFPPASDDAPPGLPTPPDSDGKSQDLSEEPNLDTRPRPATHANLEVHELSYLPPLHLSVQLPPKYPTEQPPEIRLVTEVPWLPEEILRRLEKEGCTLWKEMGHSQVLFAYIDHLREAADDGFGLQSSKTEPFTLSQELRIGLLDFDLKAKQATFERTTYECGVCLEPKKGAVCHRMTLCGHVFCVDCLQDFYNNCITEDDVGNVKCVAPRCGEDEESSSGKRRRRDRTLGPSELLQIPLEQDKIQRYVMLKRKNALESDRTTVYCPRQWCQGPARSKKTEALDREEDVDSDDEGQQVQAGEPSNDSNAPEDSMPLADRLAICTECNYAFCKICKAGWHGDLFKCDPQRKAKLTAEEVASEEYIRLHTSNCPTCDAKSQKTHGCNHMICIKCNTHFCYLCSSWLDPGNPYEHFNNPKKACHMRLWELEAGDGADVGRGFAGGYESDDNDGQDDNPFADLDDVDSEDEAEPLHAPNAPLPPRNHPRRQHVVVRLPPPRIQAAIERRRAVAPVLVNGPDAQQVPLRRQAAQAAQALPVNARHPRAPRGIEQRAPLPGLHRFLELARNDEEDEWDSDELFDESDDDEARWEIAFR